MITNNRVLILAAGDGSRWGDYKSVAKHFINIDGEKILHRTCRQFLNYTDDVYVVGKSDEYKYPGTKLFIPPQDHGWGDFAKYWSSKELWSSQRTILTFGDVYYTDDAVEKIMTTPGEIMWFLRHNHSKVTGGRPEIFTFAFDSCAQDLIISHFDKLIKGRVPPPGGWRLYRSLVRPHYQNNKMHVVIDDETTDFDFPYDLDNFEHLRQDKK
jgi:hypothetical protein